MFKKILTAVLLIGIGLILGVLQGVIQRVIQYPSILETPEEKRALANSEDPDRTLDDALASVADGSPLDVGDIVLLSHTGYRNVKLIEGARWKNISYPKGYECYIDGKESVVVEHIISPETLLVRYEMRNPTWTSLECLHGSRFEMPQQELRLSTLRSLTWSLIEKSNPPNTHDQTYTTILNALKTTTDGTADDGDWAILPSGIGLKTVTPFTYSQIDETNKRRESTVLPPMSCTSRLGDIVRYKTGEGANIHVQSDGSPHVKDFLVGCPPGTEMLTDQTDFISATLRYLAEAAADSRQGN